MACRAEIYKVRAAECEAIAAAAISAAKRATFTELATQWAQIDPPARDAGGRGCWRARKKLNARPPYLAASSLVADVFFSQQIGPNSPVGLGPQNESPARNACEALQKRGSTEQPITQQNVLSSFCDCANSESAGARAWPFSINLLVPFDFFGWSPACQTGGWYIYSRR